MFGIFRNQQVLDEATVQWIFDSFAWSLRNFGSDVFFDETILVVPSDEHFPGRVNSVHGMASLIFDKVKAYAGLSHWPTQLLDENTCQTVATPRLIVKGALRGKKGVVPEPVDEANRLTITYDPNMINNPEALIASFAHILAHYLGSLAQEPPPGGEENWPHVTELLAVFMGFGLMFANSAFNVRVASCGSCRGPAADRASSLSQYDITYALALFGVLKEIPNRDVTRHLKKSLRSFFNKSVNDIKRRTGEVEALRKAKNLQ